MFTAEQIAALRYLISKSKDGTDLSKRVLIFLIQASERLTKEVCITLVADREGYSAKEISDAGYGFSGIQSSNGSTHIDQILTAMGSYIYFSVHYGDFDPNRNGDKFSSNGQFAGLANISQVSDPELIRGGMPLRYTFWLSKKPYSREANLVVATRENLELIDLTKPGLYPNLEAAMG